MEEANEERSRRIESGDRRISVMKQRRDALNARILKATNRMRTAEHRKDTRRKILMGAWTFEKGMKDSEFSRTVLAGLEQFLVRDSDRALFSLPPLKKTEPQTQ